MYKIDVAPYLLTFKRPAGTSRGVYTTHQVWYVTVRQTEDASQWGIGECAPLHDLSCDASVHYEEQLRAFCKEIEITGVFDKEKLRPYPSMLFGLETAFMQLEKRSFRLYDTPFSRGEAGIPINGLVWMGNYARMMEQIEEKIKSGYRCIKLKIGAIAFEEELELLRYIRQRVKADEIELRVDANGAFSPKEAMSKLEQLAAFDIHSIEQPIAAGQIEEMTMIAANSPIPIALDEELIGMHKREQKHALLQQIRPQYIILKPSLHGGIIGCTEWITAAQQLGIQWWVTSALESNIGLNAIAQWCATFSNPLPQGLGTGALYHNNIEMPLTIRKDKLEYQSTEERLPYPEYYDFLAEWNNSSDYVKVQTSGSTGSPKTISVSKNAMTASARLTNSALSLTMGSKALLCMPLQFIGAKMMVVRALVGQFELIVRKPSGHPLSDVEQELDFAAMTPQQVYNSLQIPKEKERLKRIKNLIIGGAAISPMLLQELKEFPHAVYSTYGMTETVSHIALRKLNGTDASEYYTPFPGVELSMSPQETLMIYAPLLCEERLITNDVTELKPDGRFRILGRADNVINTGGVKIHAEVVEQKLSKILNARFAITSVESDKFGEEVVLLAEEELSTEKQMHIRNILSKYECPKHMLNVSQIPLTANGKIARGKCKDVARGCIDRG